MFESLRTLASITDHFGGLVYLLNNSASIHLYRQLVNMIPHLLSQYSLLDLIAMLEQFLDDVVSKDVCHKLQSIGLYLTEYLIFLVTIRSFKFLLDKTRSVLVTTKFDHVTVDIL